MARIHRRTIQKHLYYPDNHDGVVTYLELDILECEIKWTLGSITTSKSNGGDRWCCESAILNTSTNLENSAVATGLEKVSIHSNPKERQCQNC